MNVITHLLYFSVNLLNRMISYFSKFLILKFNKYIVKHRGLTRIA